MRLVIISDTHALHEQLGPLSGDVLIHCGDFCDGFHIDDDDVSKIDQWFGGLNFDCILCVGGNHDFVAQERRSHGKPVFQNAIFLQDECYEFGGLKFYGSPWLPDLDGWAYFLSDDERRDKWNRIPVDTDVLITHTPPFGILDRPRSGHSVGCSYLRAALEDIDLRVHCFGHVHASYGQRDESKVKFYNASVVDSHYRVTNPAFIVDL